MEELKPYLVPGVALIVLAAWFLVIQPRLVSNEAPAGDAASTGAKTGDGPP